jgi:hypothetical protein
LRNAKTFKDLLSINKDGMTNALPVIWYYQDKTQVNMMMDPDGDSDSLTDGETQRQLLKLNTYGFLTENSQQGGYEYNNRVIIRQCATVSGYIHKDRLVSVVESLCKMDDNFGFVINTPRNRIWKELYRHEQILKEKIPVTWYYDEEEIWTKTTWTLSCDKNYTFDMHVSLLLKELKDKLGKMIVDDYVHEKFSCLSV